MKTIRILVLCFCTTLGYAQQKLSKTSQSIKVNKEVKIDLNTSYVEIEIGTWNRDVIEVEAYIESDELSKEELQRALEAWQLDVDASNDKVIISTRGGSSIGRFSDSDYDDLLRDLEFKLADIPEVPNMASIPNIPEMPEFPTLPEVPEMPEFPKLPELPSGITTITFDYDKYQKEGEKYLAEWSKRYEKEGGEKLQKQMEAWARRFGESDYQKKMEKWGDEYAKRFEGEWAKEMEVWGEKFGEDYAKKMEAWGEKFGEEWAEKMEVWGEDLAKRMEKQSAQWEQSAAQMAQQQAKMAEREAMRAAREAERAEGYEKRNKNLRERRDAVRVRGYRSGNSEKVKKVIKLKIPKKAKLNMNVRHGELKISSVLYNATGDISHSFLVAEHIDGGDTSINVSYSPLVIDTWSLGTLNLNFVEKAQIKNASNLVLNSKSSNILVETLKNTGIIDGSFGDLTISNLAQTFKTLNLVLENSDALINLPKNSDYNVYFKGTRSKLNNKPTSQKTIRNYPEDKYSERTIMVNAKFSSVIMN
ncbi:hypothetical protein J4050_08145 [Winogradskyella sp. DF17]|uniref:Adhesin domain-containing protein n=1 Tax=Winogradskyella pelagia TaxID=2819984 RepID=A0ABS3T1T6_9FLAO|nr:hypothetical protein [Winogradskyella sp. DF17]MBO3116713.1 hypothetical protein [Winogradskyella sp. DF17]